MKTSPALAAVLCAAGLLPAQNSSSISASRLLDEAIARPGDYTQVCDVPEAVPFSAPPLPAFGIGTPQCVFLSDEMKKQLLSRRDEVAKEIALRLDKLDWLHPPKAPPVGKKPLFTPSARSRIPEEGDPAKPSGQNPLALESILLQVIQHLGASEALPPLLRLEDELFKLTQKALRDDSAPLPEMDLGGCARWAGMNEDYKDVEDWDKAPAKLKHKKRLFESLVFDREILGTMLAVLAAKKYEPLRDSTPGLARNAWLRARAKHDESFSSIKSEKDIPESDRNWMIFDHELGVPMWRNDQVQVVYSDLLRDEVVELVKCFIGGTKPRVITGEMVLDEAIRRPGSFSQLCGRPAPISMNAPIPSYNILTPRFFDLGGKTVPRLKYNREKVMPVLLRRLHNIDLAKPQPIVNRSKIERDETDWPIGGNTHPEAFSHLMLSVVRDVHALEALPELLRLEASFHDLLLRSAHDSAIKLPTLDLDCLLTWQKPRGHDETKTEWARFTCVVYHREILALIAHLLRVEKFPPLLRSPIEKQYIAGLRKEAKRGYLKKINSEEDLNANDELRLSFHWDVKLGIPVSNYNTKVDVPYSEELRDDIRHIAEEFLKTVPREKWTGIDSLYYNLPVED